MKFSRSILYILIFSVFFVFSQNINTDKDFTIIDSIDVQIKNATSLTFDYKYNDALILIQKSLKQADSLKNDSLLGRSYLVYGIINTYLGKRKKAIQNQRKAEEIFLNTKNYKYLGSAYNNIGWAYSINKKKLDSSIVYYKKALKAYTAAKNNKRITTALNNLGYNYILLGKYNKAEVILKRSLKLNKENVRTNNTHYLSKIYLSLSELYIKKNDTQKALKYANLAEDLSLKNNYDRTLVETYRLKKEIFNTQKKYTQAHSYLKKYHEKLRKVHAKEKSKVTQETAAVLEVKEHKRYLEKISLENNINEEKIKKSKQFIATISILFFTTLLVFFLLYRNNKLKIDNNKLLIIKHQQLKDLQLKTELIFLKTQIQPHFFFNTLNNLYALIIEKSDKAKDVIVKLSELMKYTLYGSKTITVPIKEEIKNIKNYLELENLRYEKTALSTIKIIGKIDHIKVPPLLFITFIENCFKHNDVNDENFKLSILFKNIDSKHLLFEVKNTYIARIEKKKEKKRGIGIENAKRRLILLYRDEYDLKTTTKNNNFSIRLKIPIQDF